MSVHLVSDGNCVYMYVEMVKEESSCLGVDSSSPPKGWQDLMFSYLSHRVKSVNNYIYSI